VETTQPDKNNKIHKSSEARTIESISLSHQLSWPWLSIEPHTHAKNQVAVSVDHDVIGNQYNMMFDV
jgi:hypothetical protein